MAQTGPRADFTLSESSSRLGTAAPHRVEFRDASTGSFDRWWWDFGDGFTSSQQNPAHVYQEAGTYAVSLTVRGQEGADTKLAAGYITVGPLTGPTVEASAAFTADVTQGAVPLTVRFTDLTPGTVDRWRWEFGDGQTSSAQNPTHVYSDPGSYTVTLRVWTPTGRSSFSAPGYINVGQTAQPPVADFVATPTHGIGPLTVQFTNASHGSVQSSFWLFGDGTTGSRRNPSHRYQAPGTYTVTLVVSGPGGLGVRIRHAYIAVFGGSQAPVANFTASPRQGTAPLSVQFTDQSTGNVTNWSWRFGDGTSSTQRHPNHAYTLPGSYAVSLTASGPGGQNTVTRSGYITVESGGGGGGGTMASSVSQFGITWTFDRQYPVGQFANGDWWVVGPVRIVSINPPSVSSGGRIKNGSMLNPSPYHGESQGWDSTYYGIYSDFYDASLNVAYNVSSSNPLVVQPNNSLFSSISYDAVVANQTRTAAVLTVLTNAAPSGSFRPPYSGTEKVIRFNKSQLNFGLLASLPRLSTTPSIASLERDFERPWVNDHIPGWYASNAFAPENSPTYGRDLSAKIGEAAIMLHLNYTNAEKEKLLISFVQLGIDTYGIVQNGGEQNWVPNGGHASGRKWPILFAGLMLNDSEMRSIGQRADVSFGEDGQTFTVRETSPGVYNNGYGGYGSQHAGMPEWGIRHSWQQQHDSVVWSANYRQCCTANAWNGFVLAARIMGAQSLWNHSVLFSYMDRYIATTRAMGDPDWQTSYVDWVQDLWDAYRARY